MPMLDLAMPELVARRCKSCGKHKIRWGGRVVNVTQELPCWECAEKIRQAEPVAASKPTRRYVGAAR